MQYIFLMQFLKCYMKIRNFSLVLLITIFYRQLQDHMGIVFCTMPEIPRKGKKNHPKLLFQFGICWMPTDGLCRLQNEQIVRYYIVI